MWIPRKLLVVTSLLTGLALTAGACSSSDASSSTTTTVAASAASAPSAATAGEAVFTPITASVLAPPIPVPTTDGRIHLAYELFLTNAMSQDITISSIAAESEGATLQELSAAALPMSMRVFGASEPTAVFGPGQSGLVWMDVVVDTDADVPTSIGHVIEVVASAPNPPLLPASMSEVGVASTPVLDEDPVVLAPPLYGQNWLDGNGCCGVSAHRGAVSPLNGALWAPERFAIDFIQLDDEDRLYSGPIDALSSYAYYGAEIHAVAPGRVVAVVDDLPEQTPGTAPTGLPVDEYGGNHVVQDIGGGRFAFYAHIQTNGVKVEVGDELETGDVVGVLGNTGNTDAPHLHFHVMDGPDPLASNGLPFVFGSFSLAATMPDDAAIAELITSGGPARLTPGVARTEQADVMPLYLDLMDFTAP